MKSELLKTLLIVRSIIDTGPTPCAELARFHGMSTATLKRRLEDARQLGAHVESVKLGARWYYSVPNAAVVHRRLGLWIKLEEARSLVEADGDL